MTLLTSYDSLTDACADTLITLGAFVRHFSGGCYEDYYLTGMVQAMFELAEVGVLLDGAPPFHGEDRKLTVSKAVLLYLLPDRHFSELAQIEHVIKILGEIATINRRFAEALLLVERWLTTPEGHKFQRHHAPQFAMVDAILALARQTTVGLAA
jgi:hypothetical protein